MMKNLLHRTRQYVFLAAALLLGAITVAPIWEQSVSALGGQVQSRFIEMSNSTPGASSVTYNVSFKPTTTNTVGGIVVDFCADSPIIFSGACTFPTGFTLGTSVSVSGLSGFSTSTGSWVTTNSLQCGAAASNFQVLLYTNTTAQTPTGTTTPINFQITGVTNTSTTGTFYARIYTFDTSGDTTSGYTCGTGTTRGVTSSTTGVMDYGGVALSTVTQISITATVQETLTFCVSGSTIVSPCGSLTAPTLTIGTGSPKVLSTSGDATPAYTELSTNANGGATVRMKATNACTNGGLSTAPPDSSGGCASIPGVGSTAQTFNAAVGAGNAGFGMCVAPGTGITADNNYKDTVNSCPASFSATSLYGMDGTNLVSTYGDPIYATTSGAVSNADSTLTFAARAANTTPAGVYQGNEILIATGTF